MIHCPQRFCSPTLAGPERRIDGTSESFVGSVFPIVRKSNAIFRLNEIIDPTFNRPDFTLSTMADFKNRYNNRRIGETCIATYWLRHPKRRQFEGIVFAPKMETPNHYNLWCGFVVEPKKGNWSKIVREGVDTDPFLSGT